MRRSPLLIATSVLLAGCAAAPAADPGAPTDDAYAVSAAVLESPEHGPQLCSAMAESYPPQCGGPDVVGWDWADVDDEESANGTTWGQYRVVGTWDGERLTLTEPPGEPRDAEAPPTPEFATPCPAPDGGWAIDDPSTATMAGREAAIAYANDQPDLGEVWLDNDAELADVLPGVAEQAVLNASFTGDLAAHERELRSRYGGPLCISRAERTQRELLDLQQRVHEVLGEDALGSSANGVRGVVEVMVTVVDDGLRQQVAEVDPEGAVELHGWLQPAG